MKRKATDEDDLHANGQSPSHKRPRSQNGGTWDELAGDGPMQYDSLIESNSVKVYKSPYAQMTTNDDLLQDELYLEPQFEANGEEDIMQDVQVETPSKKGRGRPKGTKNKPRSDDMTGTPKSPKGKKLFSTPKKSQGILDNAADRSARRKSARSLIERAMADDISGDEEEEDIMQHIYDLGDEVVVPEDIGEILQEKGHVEEESSVPATPSKRGRGRPKGSKNRKRSPTPPQDLPPHELYFAQNRGAGMRTSNNTLSSLALLDHEEYFKLLRQYRDPHTDDMEFLQTLHIRSFNQWQFELSQAFNICVYGWGSKRHLLTKFAEHVYKSQNDHDNNKIVIINGYVHSTTIRDVLNTLANTFVTHPQKLGSQPAEVLESVLAMLEQNKERHITLVVHSIDAAPIRRPATQTILSRLAAHLQINMIASADHPSFPLMWDSSLRTTFNFLFHDCTTFQPYTAEVDVVDQVHELLGRSGRRVGGKEGVSFVLKSLPQNAKNLFRVLVAEQLASMDEGGAFGEEEDEYDEENDEYDTSRRTTGSSRNESGVEYRLLYQKAVEDFICGDEVSFRTLLKEYVELTLIVSIYLTILIITAGFTITK